MVGVSLLLSRAVVGSVLLPGEGEDILCFFPSMTSLNWILDLQLLRAGSVGEFERANECEATLHTSFSDTELKDNHLHFQENEDYLTLFNPSTILK